MILTTLAWTGVRYHCPIPPLASRVLWARVYLLARTRLNSVPETSYAYRKVYHSKYANEMLSITPGKSCLGQFASAGLRLRRPVPLCLIFSFLAKAHS